MSFDRASVRALTFDVFGTVVDWHGSVVREMADIAPSVDGGTLFMPLERALMAWRID